MEFVAYAGELSGMGRRDAMQRDQGDWGRRAKTAETRRTELTRRTDARKLDVADEFSVSIVNAKLRVSVFQVIGDGVDTLVGDAVPRRRRQRLT